MQAGGKTIFITGATGFIGENLCLRLIDQGHFIKALVRNPDKSVHLKNNDSVQLIKGDLSDAETLIEASSSCDEAFHLAGFVEPWHKDPTIYERINVGGTKNVMEACLVNGIKRVVFTSTAGIFGPSINGQVSEETIRQLPLTTQYEKSKLAAENVARSYIDKGLEVIIVNPTRVYGPGLLSKSNVPTLLIDRYSRGNWRILPGTGKRLGNYVFVEDVVVGHQLAMEHGHSGENYLLGGESASYIRFFDILANNMGEKRRMIPLPGRLIIAFSYLQLLLAKLTGRPPLLTPDFARKYLYDWDSNSDKASRILGYQPRSLEWGIKTTLEWLRKERV